MKHGTEMLLIKNTQSRFRLVYIHAPTFVTNQWTDFTKNAYVQNYNNYFKLKSFKTNLHHMNEKKKKKIRIQLEQSDDSFQVQDELHFSFIINSMRLTLLFISRIFYEQMEFFKLCFVCCAYIFVSLYFILWLKKKLNVSCSDGNSKQLE